MPSYTNNMGGAAGKADPLAGVAALSGALTSHISELNATPGLIGVTNGMYPTNAVAGSMTAEAVTNGITLGVVDGSGSVGSTYTLSKALTLYLGFVHHTGDPVASDLPVEGNFAWYRNDTSGAYGFIFNDTGSVVFQNFTYISGTITLAQHGNLGSGGTEPHDFTQISGSITLAQHGNLGSGSLPHDFTQISSTISDTQHGSRSGGTLHAAATNTTAGFATAAQIIQLNQATSTLTDITSTGAVSEILNGTILYVNGVPVLTARIASVAALLGTATLADVITKVNEILTKTKAVDLMSP